MSTNAEKIEAQESVFFYKGTARHLIGPAELENLLHEKALLKKTHAILENWLAKTPAQFRMQCGEMTSQEIRTVLAVLSAIRSEIYNP